MGSHGASWGGAAYDRARAYALYRDLVAPVESAFAGRELIMEAYREAVEKRYRFFSFGDACLIL